MQVKYTLGKASQDNPYHAEVIRSQLTRNLGARFCDIRDEIEIAFDETLPPLSGNGTQNQRLRHNVITLTRDQNGHLYMQWRP